MGIVLTLISVFLVAMAPAPQRAAADTCDPSMTISLDRTEVPNGQTATLSMSGTLPPGDYVELYDQTTHQNIQTWPDWWFCYDGWSQTVGINPHDTPHDYQAYVTSTNDTANDPPSSAVAASNIVTLHRTPWQLDIAATSDQVVSPGSVASMQATINQFTDGYIEFYDTATGNAIQGCGMAGGARTCSASLYMPSHPVTYFAALMGHSDSTYDAGDVIAESGPITFSPIPFSVSLSRSAGDGATLTATTNESVSASEYEIEIFNRDSQNLVKDCTTSTTCSVDVSAPTSRYKAYVTPHSTDYPPPYAAASGTVWAPNTDAAGLWVSIDSWHYDPATGEITYTLTVHGVNLATYGSPCESASCTWQMVLTYTDPNGVQHTIVLGSGDIPAGQNMVNETFNGTDSIPPNSTNLIPSASVDRPDGSHALNYLGEPLGTEVLSDVDLASVEAAITASEATEPDVCVNLLEVDGSHEEWHSSAPDTYMDCEATAGQAWAARLAQLIGTYGGPVAVILASTLEVSAQNPNGTVTPNPGGLSINTDSQRQRVADAMLEQSAGKIPDPATATTAADDCIKQTAKAGIFKANQTPCESMPLFLPGGENPATTDNDYQGIFGGPNVLDGGAHYSHAELHWIPLADRAPTSWKNSYDACANKSTGQDCDEYPFLSTEEAAEPKERASRRTAITKPQRGRSAFRLLWTLRDQYDGAGVSGRPDERTFSA